MAEPYGKCKRCGADLYASETPHVCRNVEPKPIVCDVCKEPYLGKVTDHLREAHGQEIGEHKPHWNGAIAGVKKPQASRFKPCPDCGRGMTKRHNCKGAAQQDPEAAREKARQARALDEKKILEKLDAELTEIIDVEPTQHKIVITLGDVTVTISEDRYE